MKLLIALCFVAMVGLSLADTKTHHRGCIYILGQCSRECEVGTHAFATACGYLTPEATCDNPKPETDYGGKICDYSACYCDPPTVRNTVTKQCVPLEECPKKEVEKKEEEKKEVENKVSYPRGCVYVDGVCVRECDEGSHAHMTACGYRKPRKPPATCDNPNPEPENSGKICNMKTGSACYCDPPTVRDTTIDKCVPLEDCPKKDSTILS